MTGFGRTGKMFACEHWKCGSGYHDSGQSDQQCNPSPWSYGGQKRDCRFYGRPHVWGGLTQFGNPASCAAAIASIKVYKEEGLVENSRVLGLKLLKELEKIKQKHPSIGDVRGLGLFAAIELVKDRKTREPLVPWTVENYEKKNPTVSSVFGSNEGGRRARILPMEYSFHCAASVYHRGTIDGGAQCH